jgi:hypothetical protein
MTDDILRCNRGEDLPERVIDLEELKESEREQSIEYAYRADWCEQTAEFAKAIGVEDERTSNYHRAIEAYLNGGWFKRALMVARKLDSNSRLREIYQRYDNEVRKNKNE